MTFRNLWNILILQKKDNFCLGQYGAHTGIWLKSYKRVEVVGFGFVLLTIRGDLTRELEKQSEVIHLLRVKSSSSEKDKIQ